VLSSGKPRNHYSYEEGEGEKRKGLPERKGKAAPPPIFFFRKSNLGETDRSFLLAPVRWVDPIIQEKKKKNILLRKKTGKGLRNISAIAVAAPI